MAKPVKPPRLIRDTPCASCGGVQFRAARLDGRAYLTCATSQPDGTECGSLRPRPIPPEPPPVAHLEAEPDITVQSPPRVDSGTADPKQAARWMAHSSQQLAERERHRPPTDMDRALSYQAMARSNNARRAQPMVDRSLEDYIDVAKASR